MKNRIWVLLLTAVVLLSASCGSAGSGNAAGAQESMQAESSVGAAGSAAEAQAGSAPEDAAETKAAESAAEAAAGKDEEAAEDKAAAEQAAPEEASDAAVLDAAEQAKAEAPDAAETETDTEKKAQLAALPYEITEYIREYPGMDGMDLKFVADAELLKVNSDRFGNLQNTLDELNGAWKDQADYAFATQAKEFASGEVNEYLQGLLPFSSHQFVTVARADAACFSFYKTTDSWYGGAHPFAYQVGFSIDSTSGKVLELEDVLTDYDAFYEEVIRALEEQENSDYFFEDWKDTLQAEFYDDPSQQVNWVLTRDGISVWFNQYEIAPYAAGPVYLDFPVQGYGNLIREELFAGEIPEAEDKHTEKAVFAEDLLSEQGSYEDSVGNYYYYSYRLPEITGPDTEDIRKINAEIQKLKKDYIDGELEAIKEGTSLSVFEAGYSCVTWNGITSVLVRIHMEGDYTLYRCWNLLQDGTEADNADVTALFGLTPESFVEAAYDAVEPAVDFDPDWFDKSVSEEMQSIREKTLSKDNINASLPVYITQDRGLGFICRVYSIAGADYYENLFEIPDTEHRPDGLTRVNINPQTQDNFSLKDGYYEITNNADGAKYRFDDNTVLVEGIPCYDDGCDAMTWLERYLDHPAYGEFTDDPYSISGFAPGDIMTLLVGKDGHIAVLESIGYWD